MDNTVNKYSDEVINDWKRYERVRLGGAFNMFDPRAREATGLTSDRYVFILKHYSDIVEQIERNK
jgi:hypothetical protein